MKKIKMFNIQTEECENIPTDEFDIILVKRNSFNEGWWKGLMIGAGSIIAGQIIGTIIVKISDSKEEA